MNSRVIDNIVNDAAALFESAENVYAVPMDINKGYPVSYNPYLIQEAVYEAMIENGIDSSRIINQDVEPIRFVAEYLVTTIVKDWQTISRSRTSTAKILNNYSPLGGFSPN